MPMVWPTAPPFKSAKVRDGEVAERALARAGVPPVAGREIFQKSPFGQQRKTG